MSDAHETISADELEVVFSLVIESLRQKSGSISVNDDYYWVILEEDERYDVCTEPTSLGMGQLSEDLYFLKRALADRALLDTYLLTKLLPILQNYVDRNFGIEEPK